MKQFFSGVGVLLLAISGAAALEITAESLQKTRHAKSGLTVVSGEVVLPGEGIWQVLPGSPEGGALSDVMLEAPEDVYQASLGKRGLAMQQERMQQDYRSRLQSVYWPLAQWANEHDGRMPARADLDPSGQTALDGAMNALPELPGNLLNPPPAPHAALVTAAVFEFNESHRRTGYSYVTATNAAPILVELHPLENDGNHYVLHSDASLRRVPIDEVLMKTLGVNVRPLERDPKAGGHRQTGRYRFVAQQRQSVASYLSVTNSTTGQALDILCPAEAADGDAQGSLCSVAMAHHFSGSVLL